MTSSIFTRGLSTLLLLLCFSAALALPVPQSGGNIATPATGSSSSNPDSNADDYTEVPSNSDSILPNLQPWKIAVIIVGCLFFCLLGIIVLVLSYLKHKTKKEVKAERRRTALRMSMVEDDMRRRRRSQAVILDKLRELKDDEQDRPKLPQRVSMMPDGVLQSGAMRRAGAGGWEFGDMKTVMVEEEDEDMFSKKKEGKTAFV